MMGRQNDRQGQLLYDFNLEDVVPQDHLLRHIDPLLELEALREHLEPFYSHTGRPSIDPELMIRMLLIGYCYGIRSERRLCEEVSAQSRLPLVLPIEHRRQGARSLDVLEGTPRSISRQRGASVCL